MASGCAACLTVVTVPPRGSDATPGLNCFCPSQLSSPQPLPLLLWCGASILKQSRTSRCLGSGWSDASRELAGNDTPGCIVSLPLCFCHKQVYISFQVESRLPSALLLVPWPSNQQRNLSSWFDPQG